MGMNAGADRSGIARQWRDPDFGRQEYCLVLFRSDDARQSAPIAEAVTVANDAVAGIYADQDGVDTFGQPPTAVPQGVVVWLESGLAEGVDAWLEAVVAGLNEIRWDGAITPYEPPPAADVTLLRGATGLAAVLALDGWQTAETARVKVPWQRDGDLAAGLSELVADWVGGPGELRLSGGATSSPTDEELPTLVREVLLDGSGYRRSSSVARLGSRESRQVAFDRTGHVVLSVVGHRLSRRWLPDLVRIGGTWAQRCDWVLVMECTALSSGLAPLYKNSGRHPKLPRYYNNHREKDRDHLPDAFVWQAVTDQHKARLTVTQDLWDVEPLPGSRWAVGARSRADWLSEAGASFGPTDEVLRAARREFGDVILSE